MTGTGPAATHALSAMQPATSKASVLIRFQPAAGKKAELVAHLLQTAAELTPGEAGTEVWTVSTSPVEEDAVYVYEVYSSAAAQQAHEASPAYAIARAATNALLAGPPQVTPLVALGGKGLK